jgi:hypothetical protein
MSFVYMRGNRLEILRCDPIPYFFNACVSSTPLHQAECQDSELRVVNVIWYAALDTQIQVDVQVFFGQL